jgi:hypothetical protein
MLFAALALIVRRTRTLPEREPFQQDPADLGAPLPIAVAEDDTHPERAREHDTTAA